MSYYIWDIYKGIIKEEFAADMELIYKARDWSAAESDTLSALIAKGFWLENCTAFQPGCSLFKEEYVNSYDPQTRTLCYAVEWNSHGTNAVTMHNMFEYILPAITEKVILYYGCGEDMDHINTGLTERFQKDMDYAQHVLSENGLEALLKELW